MEQVAARVRSVRSYRKHWGWLAHLWNRTGAIQMSKVIIVDDDRSVCETLRRELTEAGYECTLVQEGGRAFEILKQSRPDLILADLMMSGVSGFQLCRMIRKDPLLYTVPVMILSTDKDMPEVVHCMEQGADDYLTKPVVGHELLRKVRGLQTLRDAVTTRDPLTGMFAMEAVKRDINHRLARGEAIAACYIEAANLKEIAKAPAHATADPDETVREAARLVYAAAEDVQIYELFAGHVGRGHFVVVLNLTEYEKFCKRFISKFDSEFVPRLQGGMSAWRRYTQANQSRERPVPKVAIGVAHTQHRKHKSADKMFAVLREVLRKALESPESCCFVDRRRVDR